MSMLTRLGLSASVAPLVFHLMEARARGEATPAKMDSQDRFWFGEYNGDKVGMLDTRTG